MLPPAAAAAAASLALQGPRMPRSAPCLPPSGSPGSVCVGPPPLVPSSAAPRLALPGSGADKPSRNL